MRIPSKLKKYELFVILSDFILGTLFSYILSRLFTGSVNSSTTINLISYGILIIAIVLYAIALLKNRNGYQKEEKQVQKFSNSFPFIVTLNSILIVAVLAATAPGLDTLNSGSIVFFIIGLFLFIGFWVWIHLSTAKKLSKFFTERGLFKNKKKSYYLLFPFMAVTGVFTSFIYNGVSQNSDSNSSIVSVLLFACFMTIIAWLFTFPGRRLICAISGEKWQNSRFFIYLLISYLIKAVLDILIF